MVNAVCFNCGESKVTTLVGCIPCGATPNEEDEMALSLALSEHLSSPDELTEFARRLKDSLEPGVPADRLALAKGRIADDEFLTTLDSSPDTIREWLAIGFYTPHARHWTTSALHRNPFHVLGASPRDDRRKIVALAEERALILDPDLCQKARADLTNARTRLTAEIAWLPRLSPRKATHVLALLLRHPLFAYFAPEKSSLARVNVLAAAFEGLDDQDTVDDVSHCILDLCCLVDELNVSTILADINADRALSNFPAVTDENLIVEALAEHKRYFRQAMRDGLNRLPPQKLMDVIKEIASFADELGTEQTPELIHDLIDSYALQCHGFLDGEVQNVEKLVDAIRSLAPHGENAIQPLVDKLDAVSRNWHKVALPIQLCAKQRGFEHGQSHEIASRMRELAVDLFNQHGMLAHSTHITALLQELFANVPEIREHANEDASTLQRLARERAQEDVQREQWEARITFSKKVGIIPRRKLSITPDGISWKGKRFALDDITRVRWGGIRHSVNGIPTGTSYTIAFGDNDSEAVVHTIRGSVYSAFIEKLWEAVCARLYQELRQALKSGREIRFGKALIADDGVTLTRRRLFGRNEQVRCPWDQIHIWNEGGCFVIARKDDNKTRASLSYISTPNTHILEHLIRTAFDIPGMVRLSE